MRFAFKVEFGLRLTKFQARLVFDSACTKFVTPLDFHYLWRR